MRIGESLQKIYTHIPKSTGPIVLIAMGILLGLLGTFLTLHTFQLLPYSFSFLNVHLGSYATILSFGCLTLGAIALLLGAVWLRRVKKNAENQAISHATSCLFTHPAPKELTTTHPTSGSLKIPDDMTAHSEVSEIGSASFKLKSVPDIKGTLYIHSQFTGPIINDQRFHYAKHIRNKLGEPIKFAKDDLYLELDCAYEQGWLKNRWKLPTSSAFTYLPLSLFEDVNEGGKVEFYYDEHLIELTCIQSTHPFLPGASHKFEGFLEVVRQNGLLNQNICLFSEDLVNTEGVKEPSLVAFYPKNSVPVGHSLRELKEDQWVELPLTELTFFEKDQAAQGKGPYAPLKFLPSPNEDGVLFHEIHAQRVQLSQVRVIQSVGYNKRQQLWVIIPHCNNNTSLGCFDHFKNPDPKESCSDQERNYLNQMLDNSFNNKAPLEGEEIDFDKFGSSSSRYTHQTFDPQKGDRRALYYFGQYFFVSFAQPKSNLQLSFGESGLQLNWD